MSKDEKELVDFYNVMVVKAKQIAERDDLHPGLGKKYEWKYNPEKNMWERRKI
jgi:hypothetical protein